MFRHVSRDKGPFVESRPCDTSTTNTSRCCEKTCRGNQPLYHFRSGDVWARYCILLVVASVVVVELPTTVSHEPAYNTDMPHLESPTP